MNQRPTAVIVAPLGLLREGLRAALSALCRLEIVGEADTAAHAITIVHDPALVLLSVERLENDSPTAIGKIKARRPVVRCIVLVDTMAQQRPARATGALGVTSIAIKPSGTAVSSFPVRRLRPSGRSAPARPG